MTTNVAASVRARLRNVMHQTGQEFQFILTRFACERFLYRLGTSPVRDRFILKGASLLAVWMEEPYRATRDIDLLALDGADETYVRQLVTTICSMPCPEDALVFDLSSLRISPIRTPQEHASQRVRLNSRLGKVNYCHSDVFAIDTTYYVDQRHTHVDLRWLYYLLARIRLDAATRDSAIPGLDREDAYARRVVLCSSQEQRAIAAFLDRATAKIDALVAKKERLIELLQEKRTTLITHAVTKGLDPNVPMKDSGVEWLGKIPSHWIVRRMKHVVNKIGSGKTPSGGAEAYTKDGVMLLRSQNVHDSGLKLDDVAFIESETDEEMSNNRVYDSDVLLNITGASLGRCCLADVGNRHANVNQHVCIIRPDEQKSESAFLVHLVQSHSLQNQIFTNENGVSRNALNFEQIGSLLIVQPTMAEQREIAAFVNRKSAEIGPLVSQVHQAIFHLNELRTAFISAAVTGKIDVRETAA